MLRLAAIRCACDARALPPARFDDFHAAHLDETAWAAVARAWPPARGMLDRARAHAAMERARLYRALSDGPGGLFT